MKVLFLRMYITDENYDGNWKVIDGKKYLNYSNNVFEYTIAMSPRSIFKDDNEFNKKFNKFLKYFEDVKDELYIELTKY